MKTLKTLVLIAGIVLASTTISNAQMLKEYSAFHRSVGLTLGSYGIGVEGSYPVGQTFNLRAGATVFPPIKLGKPGGSANSPKYEFNRAGVTFMVDWQPLYGRESEFASKWFVTVGAGYFFKNELSNYKKAFRNGEVPQYVIYFNQAPYLGTGLANLVLGERLGLSLNAGYYFAHSKEQISKPNGAIQKPEVDKFPAVIVKGLDLHAAISYNF
ncbi:hypothetical protein LPB86_01470 [Pedobacter sp. MC2016-14]|uniref:hypothetical protein n=1 Tax=Pedobacter sp. MC2016-14 TaxID=2897327 RepID=UPI001E355006|nr:hypothetical protein [Pedobacter sp. MC2016-14]MCD0486878.1 hypothetical protein [Pedobacter sp. MC2016-14]